MIHGPFDANTYFLSSVYDDEVTTTTTTTAAGYDAKTLKTSAIISRHAESRDGKVVLGLVLKVLNTKTEICSRSAGEKVHFQDSTY